MLRLALALAAFMSIASQDKAPQAPRAGGDRLAGAPFASRSAVIARNGMAATSHPLASQAAVDILKAGGSAVDAAIAANAVLALAEPTGCGLGGALFAIVWDPQSKRRPAPNATGRSPRGLTLEKLRDTVKLTSRSAQVGWWRRAAEGPQPLAEPRPLPGVWR